MTALAEPSAAASPGAAPEPGAWRRLAREPTVAFGTAILALIVAIALAAPWLAAFDPAAIDPAFRNQTPGAIQGPDAGGGAVAARHWMGTDSLGRDVASRVVFGARASLVVGVSVAALAVGLGLALGLAAGYVRALDGPIMRVMDALMAIPTILLAIAVVALAAPGLGTVIVAIVVPEVPRVVRLVRSIVLSVREEPFVEAAIAVGTPPLALVLRHILPSTLAPLIVQATYICASAILIEAILSFLGVGLPSQIPTWGNIMAEGRTLFRVYPHNILFPGIFLALTVLAINLLGDGLRDALDPRRRPRR